VSSLVLTCAAAPVLVPSCGHSVTWQLAWLAFKRSAAAATVLLGLLQKHKAYTGEPTKPAGYICRYDMFCDFLLGKGILGT